jgi:hypothetical protein
MEAVEVLAATHIGLLSRSEATEPLEKTGSRAV